MQNCGTNSGKAAEAWAQTMGADVVAAELGRGSLIVKSADNVFCTALQAANMLIKTALTTRDQVKHE